MLVELPALFLKLFAKPDLDGPLVEAARQGDARAFDALVYRYQAHIRQFVRSRLDSAIDTEDVAQEVFVAAWRDLPRFQGRSRFKTWLFGIAVNHCAEAARKHQRLRQILGEEVSTGWAEPAWEGDHDWSMVLAERDLLRQRLSELSESDRRILELYYYADLNLPEIARLLDVNLSTLKYRFYQAHMRLRQRMESRDAAPGTTSDGRPVR